MSEEDTTKQKNQNLAKAFLAGEYDKCCPKDKQKETAEGGVECACGPTEQGHSHNNGDHNHNHGPSARGKELAAKPAAFSCVLVGDSGVGKTSFLNVHMMEEFPENHVATARVGVAQVLFATNYGWIKIHVVDTVGRSDEPLGGLEEEYFKEVKGVIIMFDVTDPKTYENATTKHLDDANNKIHPNVPKVLVGNKCDLPSQRKIDKAEGNKFINNKNHYYKDLSVKLNGNINDPYLWLLRTLSGRQDLDLVNPL